MYSHLVIVHNYVAYYLCINITPHFLKICLATTYFLQNIQVLILTFNIYVNFFQPFVED